MSSCSSSEIIQSLHQENSDLKCHIVRLEEEIQALRKELQNALSAGGSESKHGSKYDEISEAMDLCSLSMRSMETRKTCHFCRPHRCQTCDERISLIPSILPLLVKNEFIGVKDIAMLANRSLQQFICVDSDDEIWLTLLKGYAPCVFTMPQDVILGIKYREWYKQLATCKKPTGSASVDDVDNFKRRDELRSQLLSMGKDGEFPPLAPPSLSPSDIMIMVEVFMVKSKQRHSVDINNDRVISVSFSGSKIASFLNGHKGNDSALVNGVNKDRLFELTKPDVGVISEDEFHIRTKMQMVRLTDYKVICVHDSDRKNIKIRGTYSSYGKYLDTSPTLLNVRVGELDKPFASVQVDLPCLSLIRRSQSDTNFGIVIEARALLQREDFRKVLTWHENHGRSLFSGVTLLHFIEDFFDRP